MNPTMKAIIALAVCALFVASTPAASITASALASLDKEAASITFPPVIAARPAAGSGSTFAFVSNFEDLELDGWTEVTGATPTVVTTTNYSGEPSLQSSSASGNQIDRATKGFVTGQDSISFQVAIDAGKGARGYFGLGTGKQTFVAVVGVRSGDVVAGPSLSKLSVVEKIPKGTAYPTGWVYVTALVAVSSSKWTMQVYVDGTQAAPSTFSVPNAANYSSALIETTQGVVDYTNIIVSTYDIPIQISGYNNMEGYGQGSGLLVNLLPAYDNLTATMILRSWSVPQSNILSFQINAMNDTGTTSSTCVGFFQLGLDVNPDGTIAPWWVPGVNCEAQFFAGSSGVSTPAGSVLVLHILFQASRKQIQFVIDDVTTGTDWVHNLSYSGGAFYAAYTQMEFQPCCNSFPISEYELNGALTDLQITPVGGTAQYLPASYMLPFLLDAPNSWNYDYYQNSTASYNEVST